MARSEYNRRIYGDRPQLVFTGPLGGRRVSARPRLDGQLLGRGHPWGTALSCEENFDGYGLAHRGRSTTATGGISSAAGPEDAEYDTSIQEIRMGLRARPLRPGVRWAQAHGPWALPSRERRLPPRAGEEVRALHGRRQGQRGRLQVRLRPPLPPHHRSKRKMLEAASSTSRAGSLRGGAGSPGRGT